MGTGPIPIEPQALERAGWKPEQLDLVEANEAFAAQACAVNKDLAWDTGKVNVNAAPSPSATRSALGGRVLTTLLHEMVAPRCPQGPGHAVHRRRHGRCHVRGALSPVRGRGPACEACSRATLAGDSLATARCMRAEYGLDSRSRPAKVGGGIAPN